MITIIITYYLLIIIIIIVAKSHNNYCSVGVMELCLLNLLILVDCFCVILTPVCCLRACHMWLTRNHMFIGETWGKFTSSILWNFEISFVSLGRFQNFKKVNSVNLSQISLLNISLLVLIVNERKKNGNSTIYPFIFAFYFVNIVLCFSYHHYNLKTQAKFL